MCYLRVPTKLRLDDYCLLTQCHFNETYFDTDSLTYGYSLDRQLTSATTKPQILRASKHTSK